MPPELAAVLCVLFIGYLFRRDLSSRQAEPISWVPFVWMFIAGSRFVSQWLYLSAPLDSVEVYSEGSPVDRAVFLLLIVCGSIVLYRRDINWHRLLAQNKWLLAYFIYCLCSVAWTDDPYVLTKRWVKDLGNPIIALILLTEPHPYKAVITTFRRLAFLFLPLSVLFIKYYPELGRGYTPSGGVMYTGVGGQKNTLGLICLTVGISYGWYFLHRRQSIKARREYYELAIIGQIAWLLYMANSRTSLVCLLTALGILAMSKIQFISARPTRILTLVVSCAVCYVFADQLFGVSDQVIILLGRDSTLTNRTVVWETVASFQANPLLGTGFMSFWTGERMTAAWTAIGAEINQAHNGYLEQYLNLGYVGVTFIVGIALLALLNVRKHLQADYSAGILRLSVIVAALMYNYSEAAWYGVNNIWMLFLVCSIDAVGASSRANHAAGHKFEFAEPPPMITRHVRARHFIARRRPAGVRMLARPQNVHSCRVGPRGWQI
jgi:exopolysaccharide production protein ExoQ